MCYLTLSVVLSVPQEGGSGRITHVGVTNHVDWRSARSDEAASTFRPESAAEQATFLVWINFQAHLKFGLYRTDNDGEWGLGNESRANHH